MRPRTAASLAWGTGAIILALSVAADFLSGDVGSVPYNSIPVILGGLGILVAIRQRENPIGWILIGTGGAFAANIFAGDAAGASSAPWAAWLAWFQNWSWLSYFPGSLVLLFLLLPDGHLLGRRWRLVVWFDVLFVAVNMVATALDPTPLQVSPGSPLLANPVGVKGFATSHGSGGALNGVLHAPVALLLVLTIVALVLRLVRSHGEKRQQLKWIVYAAGLAIAAEVAEFVINNAGLDPNGTIYGLIAFIAIGIVLPGSFALAILKYGLYEIDVVISRTLVYGSLAAFITAVYVGIVVGIGSLIGSGGRPNLALSIVATAVVAVGFQPIRERLQKFANRVVYGKRATPYEVLSEFSERVAGSYLGDEVLPRMAQVLHEGTGAEAATVWLRSADELRPAASHPDSVTGLHALSMPDGALPEIPGATRVVAVRHQDELLGALAITKRPGEALTPIEEKLLGDLAHQAGLVLKNVGLTADLQTRLSDLRASRQRLVAAQDDERRRLERNLHDGAQQNLVAIKVKLGMAELLSSKDPGKARELLSALKADTDDALETLRALARGIYPPLLADKGLMAALESQARKSTLPVTVDGDGLRRYPQEVEAAVYFCVLEALQNVQKYAGAATAAVKLSDSGGELRFDVYDDGAGFDQGLVVRGAGLTNMDDRLKALGGDLAITSERGRFTRVSGILPVPA